MFWNWGYQSALGQCVMTSMTFTSSLAILFRTFGMRPRWVNVWECFEVQINGKDVCTYSFMVICFAVVSWELVMCVKCEHVSTGLIFSLLTAYLKTVGFNFTCSQSCWMRCFHERRLGYAGCVDEGTNSARDDENFVYVVKMYM